MPSDPQHAPVRAHVHLEALTHNLQEIRRRTSARVMGVVKANAYGHGAVPIARHLVAHGVDVLAVATVPEALQLREAGLEERILVFGAATEADLAVCSARDIELTVASQELLEQVLASRLALRLHLQVDTGMLRLGLVPEYAHEQVARIARKPNLELAGVFTHLAAGDGVRTPQMDSQMERWQGFLTRCGPLDCLKHVSATGALFNSPHVLEGTDYVRPGIALYGLFERDSPLRPLMRVTSRVARVADVTRGTPVSYGGRWTAPRDTRIVTVAAGYADGVPRIMSGGPWMGVRGIQAPIVGTICMDMCMLDAGPGAEVNVGDEVVLFGEGGPSCFDVAGWANTITYDVVCGLSSRVARVYAGQ
ncbi:MAG: alanine racemase [Rhodothermales bacterium]|nr:alanine racemase [Rhodothermales bacterium]MBO6780883.1 alanine racemase [Rhodothermales bacterium]